MDPTSPFAKQGFDSQRIECGGWLGGLLLLTSVACAAPLLFVPLWAGVPSDQLLRWKPLPGRPAPLTTATLFHFDFVRPEWTGSIANVAGFSWQRFCSAGYSAGSEEAAAVAAALIEGSGFSPDPMEADEQVCFWVTAAAWLGVLGVLTICGADLLIFLAAYLRSILLLLLGGFLALCSASSLLLALGALLVMEPHGLGTAPGVFLVSGSVSAAFLGTTMVLYQASKATPTRLQDERPNWKDETEGLTEDEERARIQQALVECVDNLHDIPRLDRYRVSLKILEECSIQDLSYEEWIIEERLRMKTGKARRAVLTEEELKKATIELRIRRSPQEALKKVLEKMLEEARKGRGATKIPVEMLQEAFQDIDVTLRNRITTRELLAALKVCGIFMEGPAAEKLLWWFHREEESPDDGYLDIQQFIFLFNQVADMMAKETIMKKASRGYTITCRVSFIANLVFLCFVLFTVTQESSDPSWDMLLNVFGSVFILQFWIVIGLPMLCTVIGTKAAVWKKHFIRQLLKFIRCICRPVLRLMGAIWTTLIRIRTCCISTCAACCSCCWSREGEEYDDDNIHDEEEGAQEMDDFDLYPMEAMSEFGTESGSSRPLTAEEDQVGETEVSKPRLVQTSRTPPRTPPKTPPKTPPRTPPKTPQTLRAKLMFKSEDEVLHYNVMSSQDKDGNPSPVAARRRSRRQGQGHGVQEAWGSPDAPAGLGAPNKRRSRRSRRSSRKGRGSLIGSIFQRRAAVVADPGLEAPASSSPRMTPRSSSPKPGSRRSSKQSLTSQGSGFSKMSRRSSSRSLGRRKRGFWATLLGRRGSVSSLNSKDQAYDPSDYQEATLRATAAGANVISSFSPMQVRDLRALELLAPGEPAQIFSLPGSTEVEKDLSPRFGRGSEMNSTNWSWSKTSGRDRSSSAASCSKTSISVTGFMEKTTSLTSFGQEDDVQRWAVVDAVDASSTQGEGANATLGPTL